MLRNLESFGFDEKIVHTSIAESVDDSSLPTWRGLLKDLREKPHMVALGLSIFGAIVAIDTFEKGLKRVNYLVRKIRTRSFT